MRIDDLPTPALLLELEVLKHNLQRVADRARSLEVALRPHIKTHKCLEIAERQRAVGASGITVSTLYEAAVFANHGFSDITWAFPIVPSRLSELARVCAGARLGVVVDSRSAVESLAREGITAPVWLKIDCGYHRAGFRPEDPRVLEVAQAVISFPGLDLAGILSHSGDAYSATTPSEVAKVAERERQVMSTVAQRLEAAGVVVADVSVGSTPSISQAADLTGVTEVRPGNYALYDRQQVWLGSCAYRDCAATVVSTVVSSQPGASHCVIDAGALALSKDPGPPSTPRSMGEIYEDYASGQLAEARVVSLSQEHGIVDARYPRGERLRILPNHSCLTVAHFDTYWVTRGDRVVDRWRIWTGRELSENGASA